MKKSISESRISASGSPADSLRWLQIDGAAAYMGGVSRKTVYAAVAAGMRVVRIGDTAPHRDSRGRLVQGRMLFSTRWIDEFLEARSTGTPLPQRMVDARNSLTRQADTGCVPADIATALQRDAEIAPVACLEAPPEAAEKREVAS